MKVRILKSICHPETGKPLGKGLITELPKRYADEYIKAGIAEGLRGSLLKPETAVLKEQPIKRKRRSRKTE